MDTSMEEEVTVSKSQKMEEEAAPKWARDLIMEMRELKVEVRGSVERYEGLAVKVEEIELKQEESNLRVRSLEEEMASLKAENTELRGNLGELRNDLNEQIDRGLRDHIHFVGLPEPTREKTWNETVECLSKWLSVNLGKASSYYDNAIMRAHRGPYDPSRSGPRPIFAQMNYRVAEEIKQKLKFNQIGGVRAKDQFCRDTQSRQNRALVARREWKRENVRGRAYIAYPAILKTKNPEDSSYKVQQTF